MDKTSYRSGLFNMTNAAITPGTQPHNHSKKTIAIEPHPFPITESGGKKMASKTLQILININFNLVVQQGRFD